MKAGRQATGKNGRKPGDRRAGAVQMEFVILAVLIGAAVVTAVIYYGQTLRRQFSVASHAAAGKAEQSAKLRQESARGAAAGDFRKTGGAYGTKYSENGAAKNVDKEDLVQAEKRAEPAPDNQGETIQASTDLGTNLTLAQAREINEQGAAQEESGRSSAGREKPPVRRNILLWIILGVLAVGGLLVFLLTVRLR